MHVTSPYPAAAAPAVRVGKPWWQRAQLTAAWLSALSLCSALVWALTWFRPQGEVAIALLGAGYQENLAVPHNAYGWQGLNDLVPLCSGQRNAGGNYVLADGPRTIDTAFRFDGAFHRATQGSLVVVISAHGAADADGPYLLPNDAQGSRQGRLRLDELLDELASLPKHQQKLVCFDVTQIAGDWRLGILNNDFARALAGMENRIRAIPNLVVLCSSGFDQQSWVCEQWRRTVFLHYLLEGLSGDARDGDRDGRIDGAELHAWLAANVADWVAQHRGVEQQPILLPGGNSGIERARQIDLTIARNTSRSAPPATDAFVVPNQLHDAWQRYEQLLQQTPAGFSFAPTQWREYVDTLMRYEQLLRAGDNDFAERMHQRLAGIEHRMQREKVQSHAALQNSLSLYKVARTGQLPRPQATQTLNKLWNAKSGDRPKIWQTAADSAGDEALDRQMLRLAVLEGLYDRAAEDPASQLSRAAEIVEVVRSPLYPLPAEIHFLVMLNKYLPADELENPAANRIARALKLRRVAERAAVGDHDGDMHSPEQALSWYAEQVRAADVQRQQGEDLLFAAAADRDRCDEFFTAAEEGYEQALSAAKRVQAAFATRDRVLALLPYYSQWLADATLDPYVANARHEETLREAEQLWQQAHLLVDMLSRPDPRRITRAGPPTSDNPQPRSLVDQSKLVQLNFDALTAEYERIVAKMAGGQATAHWHAAQRALRVPHDNWRARLNMLTRSRQHSQRLLEGSRGTSHAAGKNRLAAEAAAPAMTDASEVTSHRTASHAAAMTNARWQGRVAMATLGRFIFQQTQAGNLETYDQVAHRLNVFEVEQAWWKSMIAAGEQIHARYSSLPSRIDVALQHIETAQPAPLQQHLAVADRLARLIDGAQASGLHTRPSLWQRRDQLKNLAVFLAGRTLADHWYDVDPESEPYFRRAGLAYLNDAQRLMPNSPDVAACRDKILAPGQLQFTKLAPIHLTTQQRLALDYRLRPAEGQSLDSGFCVSWLNGGRDLQLLQPAAGVRIVRRFDQQQQGGDVSVAISSQPLENAERETFVKVGRMSTQLTLHGFFRGQVLQQTVPVVLHLRPEIARGDYPLPNAAAVSLSTTDEIANRFGTGDGAIALVIDCSGSMGPPEGSMDRNHSKYAEAVAALREVLARIPRGTKISLWTFGEATVGASARQTPEETIRQLQSQLVWNPSDAAQLRSLMAKVDPRRVTPWNESPIVRTILAAKADVIDAAGFKTILVITDGMDNCFAHDRTANPAGKSIPDALAAALADTGISLNVVAFKVAGGEEQTLQNQFSVVERLFPPGKLYRVNQTETLAETLSSALGHRMRFHLDSLDRDAPPVTVDVGRLAGSEVWPPHALQPGSYRLRVNTTPPAQTDVSLNGGDVLALALEQHDGRFVVGRRPYSADTVGHRPSAQAGAWRLGLMQNQISPDQQLRAALALEDTSGGSGSFVAQNTPRTIWFEIEPRPGQADGISWRRLLGFPAPVWNATAANWPTTPDGQGLSKPQIRTWWSLQQATPYSATVKRTQQRPNIADLTGIALGTADDTVRAQSIAIENHYVEVAPGQRAEKPCLVVRLKSTPGNIYWAELLGLTTAGAEHRFYPSIGSYTGLYWPVTQAEVDRSLQGFGLVSLDVFKREAQQRGHTLQLDDLPPPDANDILPTPEFSFDD